MPSPVKAILAVAADLVGWLGAHPTTLLVMLLALVVAGQAAGIVERLDWWGTGEEIR